MERLQICSIHWSMGDGLQEGYVWAEPWGLRCSVNGATLVLLWQQEAHSMHYPSIIGIRFDLQDSGDQGRDFCCLGCGPSWTHHLLCDLYWWSGSNVYNFMKTEENMRWLLSILEHCVVMNVRHGDHNRACKHIRTSLKIKNRSHKSLTHSFAAAVKYTCSILLQQYDITAHFFTTLLNSQQWHHTSKIYRKPKQKANEPGPMKSMFASHVFVTTWGTQSKLVMQRSSWTFWQQQDALKSEMLLMTQSDERSCDPAGPSWLMAAVVL